MVKPAWQVIIIRGHYFPSLVIPVTLNLEYLLGISTKLQNWSVYLFCITKIFYKINLLIIIYIQHKRERDRSSFTMASIKILVTTSHAFYIILDCANNNLKCNTKLYKKFIR